MRKTIATVVTAALAVVATVLAQTGGGRDTAPPHTTWRTYLGGADSSQYSALDQINRSTVASLQVAWSFPAGNRTNYFNPIVVDGVMYVFARANDLVALDAATGARIDRSQ